MIPTNELGVIVIFAQEANAAGFQIVEINGSYPDAIIDRNGTSYRAEFEFMASNFMIHKHDPRKCDLIICWEHDFADSVLPVLALSETDWADTPLDLPSEDVREVAYWKQRALVAERRLRGLEKEKQERIMNGPEFICLLCGTSFETQNALNGHMNAHKRKASE